jgi:hypothetical protein
MNKPKNIDSKEAIDFVNAYKELCIKHSIRIGNSIQDEFCLIRLDKNDEWYMIETLNEMINGYSDKKFKAGIPQSYKKIINRIVPIDPIQIPKEVGMTLPIRINLTNTGNQITEFEMCIGSIRKFVISKEYFDETEIRFTFKK